VKGRIARVLFADEEGREEAQAERERAKTKKRREKGKRPIRL
jgi:hypothetical protein